MDPASDYYKILGVSQHTSQEELKKAYLKKALHNHPDKGGKIEIMQLINNAFSTLSNPEAKASYDDSREDCDEGSTAPLAFNYLNSGNKFSDEFRAKINAWQEKGSSRSKPLFFSKPSSSGVASEFIKNRDPYQDLLKTPVPSVEKSLSAVIPQAIWNDPLLQTKKPVAKILRAPFWQADLSFVQPCAPSLTSNYADTAAFIAANLVIAQAKEI